MLECCYIISVGHLIVQRAQTTDDMLPCNMSKKGNDMDCRHDTQ